MTSRNLGAQEVKMAVQCKVVVMTSRFEAVTGVEMILLWQHRVVVMMGMFAFIYYLVEITL